MYSTRVSIRDVARHAGVSPITVSNVLHQRIGKFSDETRQRVRQALQELNYIPVRSAIQNRHVETHTIGVVFVFVQDMLLTVGYRTFKGMCDRCRQRDYNLTVILRSAPNWLAPETEAQYLDRRCDGYIFVGQNRPELSKFLISQQLPVVECYSVDPPPGVVRVLPDSAAASRIAVEFLAKRGHSRIAHLAGPHGHLEAELRRQAFQDTMRAQGNNAFADCIIQGDSWGRDFTKERPMPEIRPLTDAVLATGATAVVCANDPLALDLWQAAEEKGLRVPEDISILGMDNTEQGDYQGLTTIDFDFEAIGGAAVDALIAVKQGADYLEASRVMPVTLVERRSVQRYV